MEVLASSLVMSQSLYKDDLEFSAVQLVSDD